MAYLDGLDDDDRARESGRPTPPTRPAWDAGTYGRTDDTRWVHPPQSQAPPPPPEPPPRKSRSKSRSKSEDKPRSRGRRAARDAVAADSYAYAAEPYPPAEPAEQYPSEPYPSESYPAESYSPASYAADPYAAEPYASEPYAAEPYAAEQYGGDTYPYAPEPKSVDAYPAASGPSAYDGYSAAPQDDRYSAVGTLTSYPGGDPEADHQPAPDPGRGGRNLPAAIGVGVVLLAAVLASLFVWRPAFLGVIVLVVGAGVWELVRAIRNTGANPPMIPLIAGGVLMTGLAWWGQADALTFGLIVTVIAAMIWRLADGADGYGKDVTAATLIAAYLPFLIGFAVLLAGPEDGDLRVLVTLAGVVLSDTGGYVAGSIFGRHPMAPSVSPKKSWEGLLGSLVAAAVGGAVLLWILFDVSVWWGAVFGAAVAAAAVLGDLGESLIKRDLGVKDMSRLLPGHGGIMDRLDSIVLAAPTAYVLLLVLAPPL